MNTPQQDAPPPKAHWWTRCKKQMAKTKRFAKEFCARSSGVVGKLYYASMLVGGLAIGATALEVPGASTTMVVAVATTRLFKALWDHVRDLKDAAEDLENQENDARIVARMDQTTSELEELRKLVEEQRNVIEMQAKASQKLEASLSESDARMRELSASHDNLIAVLRHFVGDDTDNEVQQQAKRAFRLKYQSELDAAEKTGLIERVSFDPERDNFVRYTGDGSDDPGLSEPESENERVTM
ncbi:hypothetical protein BTO32_14815 [Marinobacter lutaoensis]|uniref:Uncharacterized protein n=1 Tax=Marinobacter lutaoensis TaxID=135739 RepID=A0A1V2DPA4_9GAMM|nr:hypothetical protein [Marinobacter lutaoensis]ONF42483.1 hypothetical protein BTO32_14815 [Marinobacter lutaoensis]